MLRLSSAGIIAGFIVYGLLIVYFAFHMRNGCAPWNLATFGLISMGFLVPSGFFAALISSMTETKN